MSKFKDYQTIEVYHTGFCTGIPEHVSVEAQWRIQLILAARSLHDIDSFAQVLRWVNKPGLVGIKVEGKWHITFEWDDNDGASEISLDRKK